MKIYKVRKETLEQKAEKRYESFLEERCHGNLFDLYLTVGQQKKGLYSSLSKSTI